ncbi:MAG: glycosyltransferase family 2 protein [Bacteroidia bacterium]
MTTVAVCILNYNGASILPAFLPSVIAHSVGHTVYVIDNASTDDSLHVLANYPSLKIIKNVTNKGFAGGYNEGLQQITEDVYILLNSDVEVTPNWIAPIIKLMENDVAIAACQPKIKDYKNKTSYEYAGAAGGFIDAYGYPYCNGRTFNKVEEDTNQYNTNYEITWACGAALFVKRNVYWEVEGLDEDFFAHQEEIDLCLRIKNLGYKVQYCYQSEIFHLGGGTLNKSNPRKTFYNFRNNLFLLTKNDYRWYWFLIIALRLVLDGIAGIFFAINGSPKDCVAVIKAHFNYYSFFAKMMRKRKLLKQKTVVKLGTKPFKNNGIPLPFMQLSKIV